MANWYGIARSNYVRVKDYNAFKAWVETLPEVEIAEREGMYALLVTRDSDSGGWPSYREGKDGEDEEIDIAAEIAEHLMLGEVFIYCEVGAEKQCYLTAWTIAVNDKGEKIQVSIDDIYSMVKDRWGREPTTASY